MNIDIINKLFPDYVERMKNRQCPSCGKKINSSEFRDEISLREFTISGLCQKCQDSVFGKG